MWIGKYNYRQLNRWCISTIFEFIIKSQEMVTNSPSCVFVIIVWVWWRKMSQCDKFAWILPNELNSLATNLFLHSNIHHENLCYDDDPMNFYDEYLKGRSCYKSSSLVDLVSCRTSFSVIFRFLWFNIKVQIWLILYR